MPDQQWFPGFFTTRSHRLDPSCQRRIVFHGLVIGWARCGAPVAMHRGFGHAITCRDHCRACL